MTARDPNSTKTRFRRMRPSAAMLVALAALFVALGGVGYAATTIGSQEIRNNSILSEDIANGTLLSRDIADETILRSDLSPTALNIEDDTVLSRDITDGSILRKDISPTAVAGFEGPRAFAHINGNVSGFGFDSLVDEANSKGITDANVTSQGPGVYCFADLGFNPKIAIVTPQFADLGVLDVVYKAVAYDDTAFSLELCPGSEQASVNIHRSGGALINGSFYVMFE